MKFALCQPTNSKSKVKKVRIASYFANCYLLFALLIKAVHQPELDIHEIASKADVYNIGTSPKVIEEGLTAGMELIYYLVADGFKIKTPLFNAKMRFPGEYNGSETHLPEGVYPTAKLQASAAFRKYLKDRVKVEFCGIDSSDGFIAEAYDEVTEMTDELATGGNILTIRGFGLKIEGDSDEVGLYFHPVNGGPEVKANIIAVNEPRTLKVVVPLLDSSSTYILRLVTYSSAKHGSGLLKEKREVRSDFALHGN